MTGPWGTIRTDHGARVDAGRGLLLFGAEDRAHLKLRDGWSLRPGPREGDLLVAATPKN